MLHNIMIHEIVSWVIALNLDVNITIELLAYLVVYLFN
jgi:hypothetical protein